MKKLLPFFFGLLLIPFGQVTAQVQKLVMVEHFTQASCAPCAAQNPAFNQLLFANSEKQVSLKYQTNWPGYDPMNEHNPDEIRARVDYYGVTGVPNVRLSGTLDAGTAGQVTVAQINQIHSQMTPLDMSISHSVSSALDSMFITCIVRNVSADTFDIGNTVLHTAIVEEALLFPEPPGSTNETDFYNVMRKMLPNASGTPVGMIAPGDSLQFDYAVALPDYIYDYSQLGAVAFVQTNGSREVHQAAKSETLGAPEGFADLALDLSVDAPASYCEYEVTAAADLTNESPTEVTEFEVAMLVNGTEAAVETWEGSLAEGESVSVSFPTFSVEPGASSVAFEILSVNGNSDYNSLNQLANSLEVYTLSEAPVGEDVQENFETTANFGTPPNALIERDALDRMGVVNRTYFNANDPVGGYGQSAKSIFVNFYQWDDSGAQSHLIFDKIDLSNATPFDVPMVTFDYAFAQYAGFATDDRLLISVSEDCGETWTTVFDKGGASFATRPALEPYFIAGPNDWGADTVDLSAFAGVEELNVRFTGQTDWGNNLFLDNIKVENVTIVSTDEPNKLEGKVFTYPNPATDLVYLDFTLVERSQVTAQVFDISGKQVATLMANAELGAGGHQLTWQPTAAGVYLIRLATQDSAITKRVTVVK